MESKTGVKREDKFKVGDRVIIARKSEPGEDFSGITWPEQKIDSIGKIGTIEMKIYNEPESYRLIMDHDPTQGHHWTIPVTGLKRVNKWKEKQLTKKQTK